MKTRDSNILCMILLLSLTFACKKDKDVISPSDISGKWTWLYTYRVYPLSDTNPLTPQNTGIQEILVFKPDHSWYNLVNGTKADSGTYTLGHGTYAPYQGAQIFIYDSIVYSRNGIRSAIGDYYEIRHDTLQYCPGYAGRFTSYTLPGNGSKFWIKQ